MPSRIGTRSLQAAFGVWIAVALVGGTSLMASHLAALPTPAPVDPSVVAELGRDGRGGWSTVHVLAAKCDCSRRILEHLVRRGPLDGVHERILWVTGDGRRPPGADRFAVDLVAPRDVEARLGAIGAPTLLVGSPDGRVRYVGGYTRLKQSPVVADREIVTRLARGEHVEPLPVLGCAIDAKTARRLDPLGIR